VDKETGTYIPENKFDMLAKGQLIRTLAGSSTSAEQTADLVNIRYEA
jgi:hypothetical protein